MNVSGRVPVLETASGSFLPESNAILFYLANGTRFLPDDAFERAQVLRWMFFEQYYHEPNIATRRFWITHNVEMTEERRVTLEPKLAAGHAALKVMDSHLGTRDFFVANRYTIADISLYAYTHVAHEGGFDLSPYTAVNAWLERVATQPNHVPISYI